MMKVNLSNSLLKKSGKKAHFSLVITYWFMPPYPINERGSAVILFLVAFQIYFFTPICLINEPH